MSDLPPDLTSDRIEERYEALNTLGVSGRLLGRDCLPLLEQLAIEDDYGVGEWDDNSVGPPRYTFRPWSSPAPKLIAGILLRHGRQPDAFARLIARMSEPGANNPIGIAQVLVLIAGGPDDIAALFAAAGHADLRVRLGSLYALTELRPLGCGEVIRPFLDETGRPEFLLALRAVSRLMIPPWPPRLRHAFEWLGREPMPGWIVEGIKAGARLHPPPGPPDISDFWYRIPFLYPGDYAG